MGISARDCIDLEQGADGMPSEQGLCITAGPDGKICAAAAGVSMRQSSISFYLYSLSAIVMDELHTLRAGALQHSGAGRESRAAAQWSSAVQQAGRDVRAAA